VIMKETSAESFEFVASKSHYNTLRSNILYCRGWALHVVDAHRTYKSVRHGKGTSEV